MNNVQENIKHKLYYDVTVVNIPVPVKLKCPAKIYPYTPIYKKNSIS